MTANNLSVLYFETMFKTYACYFSKNLVILLEQAYKHQQLGVPDELGPSDGTSNNGDSPVEGEW